MYAVYLVHTHQNNGTGIHPYNSHIYHRYIYYYPLNTRQHLQKIIRLQKSIIYKKIEQSSYVFVFEVKY